MNETTFSFGNDDTSAALRAYSRRVVALHFDPVSNADCDYENERMTLRMEEQINYDVMKDLLLQ
jgi:hypothetical protein